MSIIRIAGVALVAVAASLIVKQLKPEFGIYIPIVGAAVIFIYAISELSGIAQALSDKATQYGLNNKYLSVLYKCIGIAYITQFASDCCKDAGENAISTKVEMFGKVMILSCTLPILFSVLDMINKVIELI